MHQVMILFSNRGTPDGYDEEHGYSGHTHKMINKDGKFVYYQMHCRVEKFKTLTAQQADELQGKNPDYGIEKLRKAIDSGNFPTWTVYIVRVH